MRGKPSHTLDERIDQFCDRLREQQKQTASAAKKDQIRRKLHQLDTVRKINGWLSSPKLKALR
jgi:hypothetical protein